MSGAGAPVPPPEPGTYAVDARDGRMGRVVGRGRGGDVRLRDGPAWWDCPPDALRPVPAGEALRTRVREVNREGRLP
ncbi:hypothetical protein ACX6XY_05635 [Streptomyces sp. O3]